MIPENELSGLVTDIISFLIPDDAEFGQYFYAKYLDSYCRWQSNPLNLALDPAPASST